MKSDCLLETNCCIGSFLPAVTGVILESALGEGGKRNQMRVRGMVEGDGRSRETGGKMTKIS